jgi:hypothetical protein
VDQNINPFMYLMLAEHATIAEDDINQNIGDGC